MTQQAMHPFAEDRMEFDRLGARVAVMIGAYLRDLPTQTVDRVVPAEVRHRLMSLPLPVKGQTPQEILDFLGREIMPWPVAIGHSPGVEYAVDATCNVFEVITRRTW